MGKIRTRFIGDESLEEKQKIEQKERTARKKAEKMAEQVEKHMDAQEEQPEKVEKVVEKSETAEKSSSKKNKNIRVHGKNYISAHKKIDPKKLYMLPEAVSLLKKIAYAKFPESIELHLNLVEMGIKGEVELPYGTGKQVRVAIVDDAVITKLEKGVIDFDILITHPSFMPKIAKFARVLGPKGLMPNPKSGTVSTNPEEVAKKFQKGTLRWKSESKFPLLHQMVAKLTAPDAEIIANVTAFLNSVGRKNYRKAFIKSTMSPALRINLPDAE